MDELVAAAATVDLADEGYAADDMGRHRLQVSKSSAASETCSDILGGRDEHDQVKKQQKRALRGLLHAEGCSVRLLASLRSRTVPGRVVGIGLWCDSFFIPWVQVCHRVREFASPGSRVCQEGIIVCKVCLLYTSPSPRDMRRSRMPSSA